MLLDKIKNHVVAVFAILSPWERFENLRTVYLFNIFRLSQTYTMCFQKYLSLWLSDYKINNNISTVACAYMYVCVCVCVCV